MRDPYGQRLRTVSDGFGRQIDGLDGFKSGGGHMARKKTNEIHAMVWAPGMAASTHMRMNQRTWSVSANPASRAEPVVISPPSM